MWYIEKYLNRKINVYNCICMYLTYMVEEKIRNFQNISGGMEILLILYKEGIDFSGYILHVKGD